MHMTDRLGCVVVWCAVVLVSVPARSTVWTPCFTEQDQTANIPRPVIMGMTRIKVVGAANDDIFHESFFDGDRSGDDFSSYVNHDVGSMDCDGVPDVRVAWGTNIHDATVGECSSMNISVTYWAQWSDEQWIGCSWWSPLPTIINRNVNTCPGGDADTWHEAMSLYAWHDQSPPIECYNHAGEFLHFRAEGFASATNAPAEPLEESCMTVIPRNLGYCPGSAETCL